MRHLARKRFGQHFLVDDAVIDRIVRAIDPAPTERLCEIGPGQGALTHPLLQACGALTVIEIDRDLAARARRWPGVTVVEADVLNVDFHELAVGPAGMAAGSAPGRATLRVVGNLPYNISTPLLFHLAAFADAVIDQHFMLQREVVQRMVAGPGQAAYGRLSVMLQCRYLMEHLFDVPPQAFDPPPAVDSAIVRMTPLRTPPGAEQARVLGDIVTSAFSQRRKILRHTLGRWLDQRGVQVDFDLQRRAEEVSVEEYLELAHLAAPIPRT
jgi:16S rRNA (adenine1518-N6/adenine1519-N6)-dimethyltransferase